MGSILSSEEQKTVECDSFEYRGDGFVPSDTSGPSTTDATSSTLQTSTAAATSSETANIASGPPPSSSLNEEHRGVSPTNSPPGSTQASPVQSLPPSRVPSPAYSPPASPVVSARDLLTVGNQETLTTGDSSLAEERDADAAAITDDRVSMVVACLPSCDLPPPHKHIPRSDEIKEPLRSPVNDETRNSGSGSAAPPEAEDDLATTVINPAQRKGRKRPADGIGGETAVEQKAGSSKRRRTNQNSKQSIDATESSPSPAREPAVLPQWFKNSRELFGKLSAIHPLWDELTGKWMMFEETKDYAGLSKITAGGRPECVTYWIRCARTANPNFASKNYDINNHSAYARMFWKWWITLQPEFRNENINEDGTLKMVDPLPEDQDAWEPIAVSGVNGLVSVIAALFFWGIRVHGMPQQSYREEQAKTKSIGPWLGAVQDVIFVLGRLCK